MFQLDSNSKELFSIPITHCSSYLKHPKTGCGNVHISTITKPSSYERPTVSVLTKKKKQKKNKKKKNGQANFQFYLLPTALKNV